VGTLAGKASSSSAAAGSAAASAAPPAAEPASAPAAPPGPPSASPAAEPLITRAELDLLRAELAEARETAWRLLDRCEALTFERDRQVADVIAQLTVERPLDPWAALGARVALDTSVLLAAAARQSNEALQRITDAATLFTSRAEAGRVSSRHAAEAVEVEWEGVCDDLKEDLDLVALLPEDIGEAALEDTGEEDGGEGASSLLSFDGLPPIAEESSGSGAVGGEAPTSTGRAAGLAAGGDDDDEESSSSLVPSATSPTAAGPDAATPTRTPSQPRARGRSSGGGKASPTPRTGSTARRSRTPHHRLASPSPSATAGLLASLDPDVVTALDDMERELRAGTLAPIPSLRDVTAATAPLAFQQRSESPVRALLAAGGGEGEGGGAERSLGASPPATPG
jgi:hypothetical protein